MVRIANAMAGPSLACLLLTGCASGSALDKTTCPTDHVVYIADYGGHTGLILERRRLISAVPALSDSLPEGPYVGIGWGDARYYRARDPGLGLALRAALWPTASALHLYVWPKPPMRYYPDNALIPVALSEAGHSELLAFIAGTFARDDGGALQPLAEQSPEPGRFYAAHGEFHLFNTCNTWVARALERTGLAVSSRWVITADDLVSQLRAAACRGAAAQR